MDSPHHHSVLPANMPGRMKVQSRPDLSIADSTKACAAAIGSPIGSSRSTADDDSSTTCRTPAACATATNPSIPAGLAYRNTRSTPANAAGSVSGRSKSAATTCAPAGRVAVPGLRLASRAATPLERKPAATWRPTFPVAPKTIVVIAEA
jgi:hypothetical protein